MTESFINEIFQYCEVPGFLCKREIINSDLKTAVGFIQVRPKQSDITNLNKVSIPKPEGVKRKPPILNNNANASFASKKRVNDAKNFINSSQIMVQQSVGKPDVTSMMTIMKNMATGDTMYKCTYC